MQWQTTFPDGATLTSDAQELDLQCDAQNAGARDGSCALAAAPARRTAGWGSLLALGVWLGRRRRDRGARR